MSQNSSMPLNPYPQRISRRQFRFSIVPPSMTIKGWIEYYGHYNLWEVKSVLKHLDHTLMRWAKRKYKKLKGHKTRAYIFLERIQRAKPELFVHWKVFGPKVRLI